MNLKKIVSAVSALAILGSTVVAFANTTKYVGPTNAEKEIRVTDSLSIYPGWSYTADSESTSDLKLNSNGLYLLSGNTANKTTGASLTFTPSAAGYSEPTAEQATADSAGGTTSFYSFTVNITNDNWALTTATTGRYVAVGFDVSGTKSTTVLGKLTEGEHTVYMTYRSIPGSEDTSRDWATISVDGTEVGKAAIVNATGIYILGPYSQRKADIQISNFRYGYVNNNTDAKYTTASYDIPQYKTADGYDKDATAAILQITAYETLDGFTVTYNGETLSTETNINDGSTVSIGVIVPGLYDRAYFNTDNRFTIGKKPVVPAE